MKITSYKVQVIASVIAGLSGLALCILLLLGIGPTRRDPQFWMSGIVLLIISIIGIVRANKGRKGNVR